MSILGILRTLILIELILLIIVFLVLGIADFSVAEAVPNPSKITVFSSTVAVILAIVIRLRIDALTIEKEVWSSDTITINQESDSNTNNGCIGIGSVFNKIVGTVIYLLLFPFGFTKIGEIIYQLNWWVFTTLIEWWPPLIYGFPLIGFISGLSTTSVISYEWLLSRIFFLGFIFPNQQLYIYTVLPGIIGIWVRIFYQILKQLILPK